jgi:hypothetical protein
MPSTLARIIGGIVVIDVLRSSALDCGRNCAHDSVVALLAIAFNAAAMALTVVLSAPFRPWRCARNAESLYNFLFSIVSNQIAQLAAQERVPTVYENRFQVLAGGLMSYGGDLRENFRQGTAYDDRILKGARPADLPSFRQADLNLF